VPPDRICEYPLFDFPIPEPPGFDFGCYPVTVSSQKFPRAGAGFFQGFVLYPNLEDSGKCEPNFFFRIRFPGCPKMSVSCEAAPAAGDDPLALWCFFNVVEDETNECSYSFDLSLSASLRTKEDCDTDGCGIGIDDVDNKLTHLYADTGIGAGVYDGEGNDSVVTSIELDCCGHVLQIQFETDDGGGGS
jgi:hypothetical protein